MLIKLARNLQESQFENGNGNGNGNEDHFGSRRHKTAAEGGFVQRLRMRLTAVGADAATDAATDAVAS